MERIPVEDLRSYALGTTIRQSWDYEAMKDNKEDGWEFWESVQCDGEVAPFGVWDAVEEEFIEGAQTHGEAEDALDRLREEGHDPDDLAIRTEAVEHYTDGSGRCTNPACSNHDEYLGAEVGREGPMMNYYYPFEEPYRFDPDEAAARLADLPLCIVLVGEQHGLALTGGGMDLSWEIAEAFTRLGMLPPTDKLRLPRMAGPHDRERDLYVIAACKRAAEVAIGHRQRDVEDLDLLARDYVEG